MIEQKPELIRNAIYVARKKELETFQRALDMQWMNGRMEDGRMGRCLALIQREAAMEKDYQERTDHAALVNAKAARETALGMEIAKVQREETCKYLRRHYLRERDQSLRELSRKLQAGYICKDLRQQILNNQYKKLQEEAEEKQAHQALKASLFDDQEHLDNEERAKFKRCSEYGQDLRQQLVSRQQQKMCQYEDTLIEKKMLDEIMKTISDEDKRELQQKREQIEKTRLEMQTFKQAQDAWRLKQKQVVLLEEKEIERQQQAMSDRSLAMIRKEKYEAVPLTYASIASESERAERQYCQITMRNADGKMLKQWTQFHRNPYKQIRTLRFRRSGRTPL